MKTGIYIILNLVNNDFYIGSASYSIIQRLSHHFQKLRKGKHENNHLQNVWNKYGEENFVGLDLEYCEPNQCIKREQFYIDTWNPRYNILRNARSPIGVKRTKETRKRMSEAAKGRKWTEEYKELFRQQKLGNKLRLGAKLSEKTKKKISESLKRYFRE